MIAKKHRLFLSFFFSCKHRAPVFESTATLPLCLLGQQAVSFARGQLEWQPALAVSNDCACALVQQQPHSSLHPPLSSKVQGGLALHLKGPNVLSCWPFVMNSRLKCNKEPGSLKPSSQQSAGGSCFHLKGPNVLSCWPFVLNSMLKCNKEPGSLKPSSQQSAGGSYPPPERLKCAVMLALCNEFNAEMQQGT